MNTDGIALGTGPHGTGDGNVFTAQGTGGSVMYYCIVTFDMNGHPYRKLYKTTDPTTLAGKIMALYPTATNLKIVMSNGVPPNPEAYTLI